MPQYWCKPYIPIASEEITAHRIYPGTKGTYIQTSRDNCNIKIYEHYQLCLMAATIIIPLFGIKPVKIIISCKGVLKRHSKFVKCHSDISQHSHGLRHLAFFIIGTLFMFVVVWFVATSWQRGRSIIHYTLVAVSIARYIFVDWLPEIRLNTNYNSVPNTLVSKPSCTKTGIFLTK